MLPQGCLSFRHEVSCKVPFVQEKRTQPLRGVCPANKTEGSLLVPFQWTKHDKSLSLPLGEFINHQWDSFLYFWGGVIFLCQQ